jgi:protein required for attachment to host cells
MTRACIAVVDACRARLYTFQEDAAPGQQLKEVQDLANPGRRLRPSELFSESRPSNKAPGRPGPMRERGSTSDDHRDDHLGVMDARFAKEVMDEIDKLVGEGGYGHLIMVASPKMLGELRRANSVLKRYGLVVDEIPRDLAKLTAAQLHDHLAARDLIPGRTRLFMAR